MSEFEADIAHGYRDEKLVHERVRGAEAAVEDTLRVCRRSL